MKFYKIYFSSDISLNSENHEFEQSEETVNRYIMYFLKFCHILYTRAVIINALLL